MLPVTIVHGGVTNTYMLKAEVSNLVGLKTLDLDPRDHLIVKTVQAGKPADLAHLRADDEVVEFAGVPISSRQQFISLIQKRGNQATPIEVVRAHQRLALTV